MRTFYTLEEWRLVYLTDTMDKPELIYESPTPE